MADQVNPLGSLAAGLSQARPVVAKSPSASEKSSSAVDAPSKEQEDRLEPVSAKTLEAAAEKVRKYLENTPSNLQFSVDKDSGDMVFKIVNSQTHEVIRQVPSEEVLVMARKLRQLSTPKDASGVLMDKEG